MITFILKELFLGHVLFSSACLLTMGIEPDLGQLAETHLYFGFDWF